MYRINQVFQRYSYLLGENARTLPFVLFSSLLIGVFDTFGVSLIAPFVLSVLSPEVITNNYYYNATVNFFGINDVHPVILMAFGIVFAFLIKLIVSGIVLAQIYDFCSNIDRSLRARLLDRYYSMTLSNLSGENSSTFVQAVHGYTAQFAYGLVALQLRIITESIIGTVILIYLFFLHPTGLALLCAGVACIVSVYYLIFRKRVRQFGRDSALAGEMLIKSVQQIVFGMREIRVYGVEERLLGLAKRAANSFASASARYQWVASLPKYMIEFFLIAGIAVFVVVMHFDELPKQNIVSFLAVFGVAVVRLAPVANQLINGLIQLRFNSFVIERLSALLSPSPPIIPLGDSSVEPPVSKKRSEDNIEVIELEAVQFRYEGRPDQVLKDASLTIHRGESIGLIGPSGGGKTTLAEIILGFWEPSSGAVKVNGLPRASFADWDLRRHFAYIPQQLFLLDSSIADNISLMDPRPAADVRQQVLQAAEAAQLGAHLATLPLGIDTHCGENGAKLSGGQRQRVALARAFYHNRSILIMDEATSALDQTTEQEIIEEIRALKGHITMIVIAHRLETVADCDRWFRVQGGYVTEVERCEIEGLINTR
jgi:ABC-type multidrug transport system fused ATPase/permease subunit